MPTEPAAQTRTSTDPAADVEDHARLAAALRGVISAAATVDAPPADLQAATEALEAIGQRLAALPTVDEQRAGLRKRFRATAFVGRASAITPPLRFEDHEDGEVEAFVTFDRPYEGPPGRVHGGYVAALFDVALAHAQARSGGLAVTVDLRVRYRAGTPLNEPLRISCRHSHTEGRRLYTEGTLYAGELVCATAQGTFHRVREPGSS